MSSMTKDLQMATYYVVPLKRKRKCATQPCKYFSRNGKPIAADDLNCRAQGYSTDLICLTQAKRKQFRKWPDVSKKDVDSKAKLFGAVAKTLDGNFQLPNFFVALKRRVVVPVGFDSHRGLLLIFTHPGSRAKRGFLSASSDPIIRNTP